MKAKTQQGMFGEEALPLFSGTAQPGRVEVFNPRPVDQGMEPLPGFGGELVEGVAGSEMEAALIGARAVGLPVTVMGRFLLSDEPSDNTQRQALARVAKAVEAQCERYVEIVTR